MASNLNFASDNLKELRARDIREDRLRMLVFSGIILMVIGLTYVVSAASCPRAQGCMADVSYSFDLWPDGNRVPGLMLINVGGCVLYLLVIALSDLSQRRGWDLFFSLLVLALSGAAFRFMLIDLNGGSTRPDADRLYVDTFTSFIAAFTSVIFVLILTRTARKARDKDRELVREALETERALQAVERGELQVRREISHRLHSSLQQHLVFAQAAVRGIRERLRNGDISTADEGLEQLEMRIEEIREREVRQVSAALYPVGLDMGIVTAIRAQLRQLPMSISVDVAVNDPAERLSDLDNPALTDEEALLAFSLFQEALTNALKHGRATALSVTIAFASAGTGRQVLTVCLEDNGKGLVTQDPNFRGLARLQLGLQRRGGKFRLEPRAGGGTRFVLEMPIQAEKNPGTQ